MEQIKEEPLKKKSKKLTEMTGSELRCHKVRNMRPGEHLLLRTAWAATCMCALLCVPLCTFVYTHVCAYNNYTPTPEHSGNAI